VGLGLVILMIALAALAALVLNSALTSTIIVAASAIVYFVSRLLVGDMFLSVDRRRLERRAPWLFRRRP